MRVSVIVPVRNEADALRRCLASLAKQDRPADEVIVVDGMSSDESAGVGREFGARVVENPRRSSAAAMNAGIRAATGDVIVRLDAHAEAAPDFLSKSLAALERTGADCVGGPIATAGDAAIAAAMRSPFGTGGAAFRSSVTVEGDADTVAFGAYRRRVFDRVGLFDASFERNADDEFHLRMRRAGLRIVLVPGIRTTYRCRDSLGALARQYFGYGRWKPRVLAKHGRLPALRAWAPPLLVAALAASVVAAMAARDPRWLLAVAWPYAMANLAASVIAARGDWKALPGLPAAFATMHLAYGLGFWTGLLLPPRETEIDRVRRVYARRDAASPKDDRVLLDARRRDLRALLTQEGLLPSPGTRVLDVGCGRGDSLAGDEARRFGVDVVPERIAAARERLPGARLAVADARTLPFRDASFDLCLAFTVMSSIKSTDARRRAAAEALRVLRPGGAVVVYDFAANPLNADVRGVPRSSLRRLFPGCRVTTRTTRGPFVWLPTHYLAVVRREGS